MVRKGQAVNQAETIGAVGSTGWATGPHLHFEFRVNGRHQDPLTIARQSEAVPGQRTGPPGVLAGCRTGAWSPWHGAASLQRGSAEDPHRRSPAWRSSTWA